MTMACGSAVEGWDECLTSAVEGWAEHLTAPTGLRCASTVPTMGRTAIGQGIGKKCQCWGATHERCGLASTLNFSHHYRNSVQPDVGTVPVAHLFVNFKFCLTDTLKDMV